MYRLIRSSVTPVLVVALALASCSARTYAPVRDQSKPQRTPESVYREVRAGDTLYSIAWESGRDVRELAAWNQLEAPYVIYPGQRLRLYPPTKTQAAPGYRIVAKGDTLYGVAKSAGVRLDDLAAWNRLSPPYLLKPGQRLRITAAEPVANPTPKTTARRARSAADAFDRDISIAWSWPAKGALLERYSSSGPNKGIDIGGTIGQTISAAAAGKVVYQGSGLRGYGRLIIVQHSADFLSAYAHCEAAYVKEGDVIKTGQKIADMGSSGTDRVKLHFEIRRRGTPVDPLMYLPKL